ERCVFFSSRRRHTRLVSDWSSDVCSSDLGRDCRPLAGALLDFWQADDDGSYDNQGFRLRGHQFTDAQGRYLLSTIVPAAYAGRTDRKASCRERGEVAGVDGALKEKSGSRR